MVVFRYYRQLLEQVDNWTAEMIERYKTHLMCRKGCDLCCQRKFTVTAVEAYNISRLFHELPAVIQRAVRKRKQSCAFLVNSACTVYESRPIICRTFGLPSLHRKEEAEGEISWCELNFTNASGDFGFQADGIIDIDILNLKIEGVNRLFLKESGLRQERISMDEIPNLDPGVLESHN
jgi:Fe-S-cluster containining protein